VRGRLRQQTAGFDLPALNIPHPASSIHRPWNLSISVMMFVVFGLSIQ
jgi:hypothetical protein